MITANNIEDFLNELKAKLRSEMPKIRKEIALYERKMKAGKLNSETPIHPQFNG